MNHYIKIMSLIIGALMQIYTISAQTPVANRVRAAAENLPEGCNVVAKYTDNKYHCLFYTMHNRLYKYDVITNRNTDVNFTPFAYSSITASYIAPKENIFSFASKEIRSPKLRRKTTANYGE